MVAALSQRLDVMHLLRLDEPAFLLAPLTKRVSISYIDILIYLRVLKNLKILTRVRMRDLRVLYSLFDTFPIYMLF